MKWRLLIGLAALWLGCGTFADAAPQDVTVRLFEAHSPVRTVMLEGPVEVFLPERRILSRQRFQIQPFQGKVQMMSGTAKRKILFSAANILFRGTSLRPVRLQVASLRSRTYEGLVSVQSDGRGGLRLSNRISAQRYVETVVGSETWAGWPNEALKAQAVLTQSRLSRSGLQATIGDSTQSEVYLGVAYIRPEVHKAVSEVWGQILTWQKRPILPYYHASCAGGTSDSRFLDQKSVQPWLRSVSCHYCQGAPFSRPTRTSVPKLQWNTYLKGDPRVLKHDAQGRPLSVQLGNGQVLSGYQFWLLLGQRFGWDKVPGSRFSWRTGKDGTVTLTSTGAGHGVGLCQWGSVALARAGKSYRQILAYYFPGTQLTGAEMNRSGNGEP
jgi:stage II sporulation protein D